MRRMMRYCRRVAEVYDISPDEVKESYLEGEDLNENAVVLEDIAWAERYGKNFDWKIFAIERDTLCAGNSSSSVQYPEITMMR